MEDPAKPRGPTREVVGNPDRSNEGSSDSRRVEADVVLASRLLVRNPVIPPAMLDGSLPELVSLLGPWIHSVGDRSTLAATLRDAALFWTPRPWGSRAVLASHADDGVSVVSKALFLLRGSHTSLHSHEDRAEVHFVLGDIEYEGDPVSRILIGQWTGYYVGPGVTHQFIASGAATGVTLSLHVERQCAT